MGMKKRVDPNDENDHVDHDDDDPNYNDDSNAASDVDASIVVLVEVVSMLPHHFSLDKIIDMWSK